MLSCSDRPMSMGGPAVFAEVGQPTVAELVQGEAVLLGVEFLGGPLEQVFGAFVGQPAPAGVGAQVDGRGRTGRGGRRSDRNNGPRVRPAMRRGSSRAVPDCQCTQRTVPPLAVMRPRLLSVSRSSMFSDSTESARAADSYSSRHSVFSAARRRGGPATPGSCAGRSPACGRGSQGAAPRARPGRR